VNLWTRGAATGVGSLPGQDVIEATKLVFGELPELPHLPELPARGPGSDITGRGAGLLMDLPVELYAGQWRVASHAGQDLRRTRDLMDRDLDALMEAADGYIGPLKVQAPGPWALSSTVDLQIGGRLLRDRGAVRDLTASLAEGLRAHVEDVRRRVPGATVLLQLDEPSLPAVLAGNVPSESGLGRLRPVEATDAEAALRSIVDLVGAPVIIHCCGAGVPLGLLQRAGASAVSIDLGVIEDAGAATLDQLGGLIDAGLGVLAGAVPSAAGQGDTRPPTSTQVADRIRALWHKLGFRPEQLPVQVVVTPTCGLAGASPEYARAALSTCVEAGRRLAEVG
jgi:methionine synthase II (cobalamin-independent)